MLRIAILLTVSLMSLPSTCGFQQAVGQCKVSMDMFAPKVTPAPTLTPPIIQDVEAIISARFQTTVRLKSWNLLTEPDRRNQIFRLVIDNPADGVPNTLICKMTVPEQGDDTDKDDLGRFSRDWAGLAFLTELSTTIPDEPWITPKFYGGSLQNRFIVLEDLGDHHISLVDALTGTDPVAASASLRRYMKSMGRLHALSHGKTGQYRELLTSLDPQSPPWQEELKTNLDKVLSNVEAVCKTLDLPVSEAVWSEITSVVKANIEPGPFTTLIHGDICPDNVFDFPDQNRLDIIDFEWVFVRNALLDGTYLRMSMPTCWCSKRIPEELLPELEGIYRDELAKSIPEAKEDIAFDTAYMNACAWWMLGNVAGLKQALKAEKVIHSGPMPKNTLWRAQKNQLRPKIISRLKAFVDVAKQHNHLPALQAFVTQILEKLAIQWPDVGDMDVFPAFAKS